MEAKTQACLASQLRTLTQNADAFEYQGQAEGGTINTFGRTCCIMACPIDARRIDFTFPTTKLSKKVRRDIGRYSTFFPEDFIPSGEEQLLSLESNAFLINIAAVSAT